MFFQERYCKLLQIGRGTFGEAWLVESVCSGRKYVSKEIRLENLSEEDVEKTKREAAILERCKHINIVRYKGVFFESNPLTMHLVMEYADGGDLSVKVKSARESKTCIPESYVLHWLVQILFAVQYLHSNNILHRDLKTQNIFLTKNDIVKLGDFGIARYLRNKEDLARTAVGTPYFLSPEICQAYLAIVQPYNHKSDMWAIGCILYELCALAHPFEAETFTELMAKILSCNFSPIPCVYTPVAEELTRVLLRINPHRRPSAQQVLLLPALKLYVSHYLEIFSDLLNEKPTELKNKSRESLDQDKTSPILEELHSDSIKNDMEERVSDSELHVLTKSTKRNSKSPILSTPSCKCEDKNTQTPEYMYPSETEDEVFSSNEGDQIIKSSSKCSLKKAKTINLNLMQNKQRNTNLQCRSFSTSSVEDILRGKENSEFYITQNNCKNDMTPAKSSIKSIYKYNSDTNLPYLGLPKNSMTDVNCLSSKQKADCVPCPSTNIHSKEMDWNEPALGKTYVKLRCIF